MYVQRNSFLSNNVTLRWGASADDHVYKCSYGFPQRFKIPCRHVLAAAKGDHVFMVRWCLLSVLMTAEKT